MPAVWMYVRVELRARWRAMLALALLLGVVSGSATAAVAGARRTETAYPRFLEKYGVFDATVSTGRDPKTDEIFDEIMRLPQVAATSRGSAFPGRLTVRGHTLSFPDVFAIAKHDADGTVAAQGKVLRGRLPDPAAVGEAVAGYALAEQLGLEVGDVMTFTPTSEASGDGTGSDARAQTLRLVGVVAFAGGFETLTGRGFPNVIVLTPAFFRAYEDLAETVDDSLDVALVHGDADLPAFAEAIRTQHIPLAGPPQAVSALTSDVQAVNRVPVVALWIAAAVLALAALAICGQAIGRETAARSEVFPTVRALGMSRAALVASASVKVFIIAFVGAVAALGVAVLLSPLMPLGLARVAEPSPGFSADWLALAVGAAATLDLTSLAGVLLAARVVRRVARPAIPGGRRRESASSRVLAREHVPVSIAAGTRFATLTSRRAQTPPVRTALLGAVMGIAAVTAALVFAASFDHLVRDQRLLGYAWDAAVVSQPSDLEELAATLPSELVTDTWKGHFFASVRIDGLLLDAFASEGPPASIIHGRPPQSAGEVALDPRTLDRLNKGLGDNVSVASGEADPSVAGPITHQMRVVGVFAVPRLPFQADENPAQGAAFTPAGFATVSPDEPFDALYVTFHDGVDEVDAVQRLKDATAERAFAVVSTQRIGAVRSVQRIAAAPWYLAGVLALLAAGTLAHTILLTTHRRRKDLAILRTLGFLGRQIRSTIAWFAMVIVGPALLLAIPGGIVAGRWSWRLFASYLAVVPVPITPLRGAAIIAVAVLALALLVAAPPARTSARTRTGHVLNAE